MNRHTGEHEHLFRNVKGLEPLALHNYMMTALAKQFKQIAEL